MNGFVQHMDVTPSGSKLPSNVFSFGKICNPNPPPPTFLSNLTEEQIKCITEELQKPMDFERVHQVQKFRGEKICYIPTSDAISTANRIFGNGGWASSIVHFNSTFYKQKRQNNEDYWVCTATATVRVWTILGNSHDGHATFTSMQKSKKFGDAFDIAYKGSVSDATKRALRKFGNALGNCLYSEKYRSEYKMHLARKGAKKKAAVAAKLRELAQKRLEKQQLNTTTTRFSNSCSSNSRKRPIELTTPKDMSSSSKIQKTSSAPTEKEDTAVSTSQQQREVECTVDVAEETKEEKDEGESILTTDDAFEIEGELVFENDDYDDGVRWSQVETQ